MIRVLQFADIVNRYDFIDTIVQRADPHRFQIGICVRSELNNIAAPVYGRSTPRWLIEGTSRVNIPHTAIKLARILRAWKADILHTHHYDQAVIGWLATRLHERTRLIVGRHYSDSIYRLPRGVKQRALLRLERTVNNAASRIIVPSTYIFDILTTRQAVSAEKIDLIPYGFEPQKYVSPAPCDVDMLRKELGLEDRFVIGTFGRLHEEKGHRILLEAIAQLKGRIPHLLYLIVGEGPERAAIEQQIGNADLSQMVRLLGWRLDAMTLMSAMDAIVQPTLQEAFSQVMVEALWMRKPLVITDVSGAPDIIQDGRNGLLVPRGNVAALVSAIERLAENSFLRERLGNAGYAYVEQHLVMDKVIKRYEQSFSQAMQS